MNAKIVLFLSTVAATYATTILESGVVAPTIFNSGIIAPGLVNSRILAPGVIKSGFAAPGILTSGYVSSGLAFNDAPVISAPLAAVAPSTIATSSVVATPGPIASDKRIFGATGVLAGTPLVSSGLLGAAPIGFNRGILSPIGHRNTGILTSSGSVKTLLK